MCTVWDFYYSGSRWCHWRIRTALSMDGVHWESYATAMTPARMHGSDIIAARPIKRPWVMNPEGRPGENGSPVWGDSTPMYALSLSKKDTNLFFLWMLNGCSVFYNSQPVQTDFLAVVQTCVLFPLSVLKKKDYYIFFFMNAKCLFNRS